MDKFKPGDKIQYIAANRLISFYQPHFLSGETKEDMDNYFDGLQDGAIYTVAEVNDNGIPHWKDRFIIVQEAENDWNLPIDCFKLIK